MGIEFVIGFVTSAIFILAARFIHRKFKDRWETIGQRPVVVDHFYPLTGNRGSEKAMVIIERNKRTGDIKGKIERLDGTTRKLGKGHTRHYFEMMI